MQPKPAKLSIGRIRLIGAALTIALVASAAGLYVAGGATGNTGASCAAARSKVASLAPQARGEVAAFLVERNPSLLIELAFQDGEGRPRKLSEFRGKTILLNLWATWCAPCRHEMPALDTLQSTLGGPNFEVLALSIDLRDDTAPRRFYAETGIKHLAFYQDRSARVFQELRGVGRAVGMPTTILIDAEGCTLGHLSGPAEWASPDAVGLIRTALSR
jgi:thiol-disulfide isomerase/thioredoxin